MPTGTGGTIADGTYVLTGETYYGLVACSQIPISATLRLSSGCGELAGHLESGAGGALALTQSFTFATGRAGHARPHVLVPRGHERRPDPDLHGHRIEPDDFLEQLRVEQPEPRSVGGLHQAVSRAGGAQGKRFRRRDSNPNKRNQNPLSCH